MDVFGRRPWRQIAGIVVVLVDLVLWMPHFFRTTLHSFRACQWLRMRW